ncbi:MAG: serine hydrolase domain-containing protein, partial [Rikenellaceae bacterium]
MNLRSPKNIVIIASSLCLILAIVVNVATAQRKRSPLPKQHKQETVPTKAVVSINKILNNEICEAEGVKYLDRTIEKFMRKWGIKGGSFALMRGDSLIYAKGYGYANLEDGVRCDVGHTFRIASASKLITATAIMKLSEQGLLSLDSQVFGEDGILNDSMFLDIKSKYLKKITVEHLLRHTSGFSSPIGDVAFNNAGVARTLDKSLPLSLDDMVVYAS